MIDIVGWSRGEVIVATVAANLKTVTTKGTTFAIIPQLGTFAQSIPVHWIGLFDAVSQMGALTGRKVDAPHHSRAKRFLWNVVSGFQITHTSRSLLEAPFPTETGFTPSKPLDLPGGSTHGQVDTNGTALNMMINNAWAKGVPVR